MIRRRRLRDRVPGAAYVSGYMRGLGDARRMGAELAAAERERDDALRLLRVAFGHRPDDDGPLGAEDPDFPGCRI